jgi:hypothetical protein
MPGGENKNKINIIVVLEELLIVVENSLEKEIKEIIIILI